MRKQLLSIAAVLVGIVAQAQQMDLPVTFDVAGTNYGLIGFGGAEASTIEADPTDGSNTVAKVIKSATAELWAGTTITDAVGSGLASPIPFTETNTQMTLRVWSPDAGIPVRLKVEDHTNQSISVETEATTTAAGQWETLIFNFSNQATGTAALNIANSYNKASVFFNFGTTGSIAGEKTYYFDDLQMGQGAQNQQMDLPVTFDVAGINYGLIGFGGAEASSIEADPTDGANTVAKVIKSATAELWAGTTITDAVGSGLASPIPFTETNTQMTLRVWSPDAGIPVRLKVENSGDAGITVETEATTTAAGQWETLTFNFSNQATGTAALNLANSYNKASVFFNFGTTGSVAGEKTYYFDDLQMGQVAQNQQMDLPVTFDVAGIDYGVIGFGGAEASTIEADPANGSNTVVKVIKSATAQLWAGTTITDAVGSGLANPIPFTETNTQMTLRVWSPDAGIPVRLKVEDHTNQSTSVETEALTTLAGQWETLTFNFANQAGGTAALNLANTYDKASVFFNFGTTGEIAGEKTYYFDDLQMGQGGGVSSHSVLFRVDMSNVTASFTTVNINGTFNNWCGGCAPMSDTDGDNIWELPIVLAPGIYEYKFTYDAWNGQESLVDGSSCTITTISTDTFINRKIIVSTDSILNPVCWGSCDPCVVGFNGIKDANPITFAPNPANDVIRITLEQSASTPVQAVILNAQGQQIERLAFIGQTTSLNTSNLPEGLYFLHVIGKLSCTKSFVVSH